MKKLLIAVALFGFAGSAFAQPAETPAPEPVAEKKVEVKIVKKAKRVKRVKKIKKAQAEVQTEAPAAPPVAQ